MDILRFFRIIGITSGDLLIQFVHQLLSQYGIFWLHLLTFIFVVNPIFYGITDLVILRIDPTFEHKSRKDRLYTIKNISKSFVLCLLTIYCSPMFYQIIRTNIWPSSMIIYLGNVYVSTDVTALLLVPQLPINTKVHHYTVLFLGIINTFCNYQVDGIHRALTYLTYLSMIPYVVNTRLGFRFIEISETKKKLLSSVAAIVYSGSIVSNFIVQHYYIFFKTEIHPLARILYFIVYYLIFYDDILLLKYLVHASIGFSIDNYIDQLKQSCLSKKRNLFQR